jgi:tryptophan synthase alpha chain
MNGITGSAIADTARVADAVRHIKKSTDLPICVGFGVKTPEQAAAIAEAADGVVVGTAIVKAVAGELDENGKVKGDPAAAVTKLVSALAASVRATRLEAAQ